MSNFKNHIMENMEVEWYSGKELHSRPKRVKVNGVWEDVFTYEKIIREDKTTKKREIVFRCHIGDNRIIEVVVPTSDS